MKQNLVLTITSVLSVVFMSLHVTDDIVRGFDQGGTSTLIAIPIFVVWLYGALVLAGRRSGYVIVLLGSLMGLIAPLLHITGSHFGETAKSSGAFFFIWTMVALGVTALLSIILAVRGLWSPRNS